ncbi:MAG: CapA family protein [Synergistaceae bacterium]|jgi:poly-gamma-glutamate synthesis protein (capsule biosynthesis protein)|nr:CapA family protein [Synergistaceae bacterium]
MNNTKFFVALLVTLIWGTVGFGGARVVFVGDIMTHKEQLDAARRGGSWDFTPQFRRVRPLFENALVVGNLETVFAGEKSGFAGYPSFNTPDELADALVDLGVGVVTLANNHILDRGTAGAQRAIEVLDKVGIRWTGLGGEPLTVDYAGLRWTFVSYSYGSNRAAASGDILNTISDNVVEDGLSRARLSSSDVVVACFHWGNEYQYSPTARQRQVSALSFANGANLVIGTHPHVLQPMEVVKLEGRGYGLVAYSLGNFVSYQRTPPRERSVILAVDVEKTPDGVRLTRVSAAPTRVSVAGAGKHRLVEVVYAGESPRFNHAGLPKKELQTARQAGRLVLDFLGAAVSADAEGFYTLWDATSPDALPKPRRKTPQ